MSLPSILRQIAKKASHPNALIHKIQLAKAKGQLLPAGQQLGDGREDVFALEAPGSERKVEEGGDSGREGDVGKEFGGDGEGGGVRVDEEGCLGGAKRDG